MTCPEEFGCGVRVHSVVCLANELGLTVEETEKQRVRRNWPHLKPNRTTVRYTDAQVEQIKHSLVRVTKAPAKQATSKGQTMLSARRHQS